jgi:hypothetical protein
MTRPTGASKPTARVSSHQRGADELAAEVEQQREQQPARLRGCHRFAHLAHVGGEQQQRQQRRAERELEGA